jgi:hypothetical protein
MKRNQIRAAFVCSLLSASFLSFSQNHVQTAADSYFSYDCSGTKDNGKTVNIDDRQDGCSGPSAAIGWSDFFKPACNEHDVCYAAPWEQAGIDNGRKICDDAFMVRMTGLCKTLSPLEQAACLTAAGMYYDAVRIGASSSFDGGQKYADK